LRRKKVADADIGEIGDDGLGRMIRRTNKRIKVF
jgi:hypothetical protein